MSNDSTRTRRPAELDLSKLSADEVLRLRDGIMEAARHEVDPNRTGFRPVMETDDVTFFNTDDVAFKDWWDWIERVTRVISDGFTLVALGVIASGFALAAAHLYTTPAGARWADPMLGAAVIFAAGFLVATGRSITRGR